MAWLIKGTSFLPRFNPEFEGLDPPKNFFRLWSDVAPMPPSLLPTTLQKRASSRRQAAIPCFFRVAGVQLVCDQFRALAEELEPGKHEFHPVRLLDKSGADLNQRFYILNILAKRDVLTIEKSDVHWGNWREFTAADGSAIRVRSLHLAGYPKKLFASRQLVNGPHLWRGDQHLRSLFFVSDRLMKAVDSAGLKKLDAFRVVEE